MERSKTAKGKVWVLDTGTKGTGAEMVPLEKVLKKPAPAIGPAFGAPKGSDPSPPAPEPIAPARFKVVDVMTRQVLAEGTGVRATLELLEGIRSVVDVNVFVWEPKVEEWRMLSFGDQKVLWGYRGRLDRENAEPAAA